MEGFHLLDWAVLGLFVLALIGIVIWVSRMKEETSTDYFLAGRDVTWLAIGASIFASNIGSEHLVGLAGAGASSGMAMAHWEMHGWMILVLGWVFVPFYARSMVFTMPEFLERRYNAATRSFLSIISLISYVLTKVAVTVYAGGIVFKQVFGIESWMGIDFFWIGAIGLVIGLIKVGGWGELKMICDVDVNGYGDGMMSSLASLFNSSAMLFTVDFYKKFRPDTSEKRMMKSLESIQKSMLL